MEPFTQQLAGMGLNTTVLAILFIAILIFWATRKNDPTARSSNKGHVHTRKSSKGAASSLDQSLDNLFGAPPSENLHLEFNGEKFEISANLNKEVMELIKANQKIPAIKVLREELGVDLLTAKTLVEQMAEL